MEKWVGSTVEPYTTVYLSHIWLFQRQVTTSAFKLAGGVDLTSSTSSSRAVKQNPVAQNFISKITKAFLDSLYAFLDGLVHLASDDSPNVNVASRTPVLGDTATANGTNALELLDLQDMVSATYECSMQSFSDKNIISGHTPAARGGVVLSPDIDGVLTAMSEKRKNWESSDIYNLTMSSAMVRHCEVLRREILLAF